MSRGGRWRTYPCRSAPQCSRNAALSGTPRIATRAQRIGDPAVLRRSVEGSLKRLGVETLELLLMHLPASDGTPLEGYWQTLLDLKAEGKARAVGLSNHSATQLETCRRLGQVDALQNPFSALKREIAAHDLRWCADHGTGVIVYSPLQTGLLSGAFTRERAKALSANDWRSRAPLFKGELERIATSILGNGAGAGPARPA